MVLSVDPKPCLQESLSTSLSHVVTNQHYKYKVVLRLLRTLWGYTCLIRLTLHTPTFGVIKYIHLQTPVQNILDLLTNKCMWHLIHDDSIPQTHTNSHKLSLCCPSSLNLNYSNKYMLMLSWNIFIFIIHHGYLHSIFKFLFMR